MNIDHAPLSIIVCGGYMDIHEWVEKSKKAGDSVTVAIKNYAVLNNISIYQARKMYYKKQATIIEFPHNELLSIEDLMDLTCGLVKLAVKNTTLQVEEKYKKIVKELKDELETYKSKELSCKL